VQRTPELNTATRRPPIILRAPKGRPGSYDPQSLFGHACIRERREDLAEMHDRDRGWTR